MMDDDTIDRFTGNSVYDGSEKTPLYCKNDNEKTTLNLIVAFCTVFCVGILVVLLVHIHIYGTHQLVPHGSVASDDVECSQYGIEILKIGGNAVDAAITSALCNSIALPHLSGLGGNGVMLVYDHRSGTGNVIDFRATRSSHQLVGIPGFLAGLYYANSKYGILPWKTLVEPSIKLAKRGVIVTESLLEAINQKSLESFQNKALKDWLTIVSTYSPGQVVKVPDGLINTLNLISSNQLDVFYEKMTKELSGLLRSEDINNYEVQDLSIIKQDFMNYSIITSNKDTGGPILFEVLSKLNVTKNDDDSMFSSLPSSFKDLGDNWLENTGLHIATTDVFDLYVTVVSGLGSIFGSGILTRSGYMLNNALYTSSEENNISQRPSSLYLPFIAVEKDKICGRRIISGSADVRDGTQILLSIIKTDSHEFLEVNKAPRIRFNNVNIAVEFPLTFPKKLKDLFLSLDFNVFNATLPYPTSNIIQKLEDRAIALSDSRGSGNSFTI
ncbi:glutathione hydrolase 7-like isoform X1 [Adelges cooleyi]|uniref:glutathione hydrolase 7-like isoform X1 n=1 Tax=Adelges cooleyi TaxID=133065 RepID=UPI0021803066|nr:glutathione hydrolase 7-like isoform X1 [Adelges cooleyi]